MQELQLEGQFKTMAAVQDELQDDLLSRANVVGVGLGQRIKKNAKTDEDCISVFVTQKLDESLLAKADIIRKPTTGKGSKVTLDVVETGPIFAGGGPASPPIARTERFRRITARPSTEQRLTTDDATGELIASPMDPVTTEEIGIETLIGQVRPAEGGYSVGHYRVTAGTIATCVYDESAYPGIPSKYYILSNNHVLANSNNARIGDPILQPGSADGGRLPGDQIARLSRFIPIDFTPGANNYVDAAIAEGTFRDLDREIHWIGYTKNLRFLTRTREIVQKTGRTTNYTTGRVMNINATVNVNYGGGRVARMVRQIVTTAMSAPGDSGSLLCDMEGNAVGLLFAGSSRVTIHNHIYYVKRSLGIRFGREP